MEIIGYFASLLIGISLGLIGGGGSILTVPVLVYLFGVNPILATAYSLFVVGASSLVGAIPKYRQGLINVKTAVIFGIPSIAAVYATRKFIVPLIPSEVFTIGDFIVTKSILMMVLFAVLMVSASISMIRGKCEQCEKEKLGTYVEEEQVFNYPMILLEGAVVGTLTGLVGAFKVIYEASGRYLPFNYCCQIFDWLYRRFRTSRNRLEFIIDSNRISHCRNLLW
jgi:uncharacterized membrane protein YfcA